MLLSEIQDAIISRIEAPPGLIVGIPHVIFQGQGEGDYRRNNQIYASVAIVPLENRERVYCSSVLKSGFILANVFAPDGSGSVEPTQHAEKFLKVFPEGLQFNGITIPDEGDVKGQLPDDKAGWFYTSALIYFEAK